ncbi:Radical SAM domain protein [Thermanaerovibrio acidaminovorans DSM 6589]|uniref:Radical SAM domain protein n=1 Tax=Thermanaerovibrio acidaminovorans (strain ATCC 49978 / DSM 6589 / Su883) TaxID=525903 RepID=D1B9N4_THEAS|nr:TIGR01212 family radical SAM protein [Thermanaerovibrio acidaminovorans]ACZ18987.1 Radical SAM domain protein [Thermanaerovibrio acidaminovorans DSM 6589]
MRVNPINNHPNDLWNGWSGILRRRHGGPVRKLTLDTGSGCPNRRSLGEGGCIFCDPLGGGDGSHMMGIRLEEQIRIKGERILRSGTRMVILYFQSYSFTNAPIPDLERDVELAIGTASKLGISVVGVSFGIRPDQVPMEFRRMLSRLVDRGLETWAEVGVQTMGDRKLEWLKRGHHGDASREAVSSLASIPGVLVCAHLIGGIPMGEVSDLADDARAVFNLGGRAVKFHPLHVLAGSELDGLYRAGLFSPVGEEEYMEQLILALRNMPPDGIVQRLTADAPRDRLVAPDWILDKGGFIDRLRRRMVQMGLRQGDLWGPQ